MPRFLKTLQIEGQFDIDGRKADWNYFFKARGQKIFFNLTWYVNFQNKTKILTFIGQIEPQIVNRVNETGFKSNKKM